MGAASRVVSWFSCGAASAVATKLAIQRYGDRVVPAYCETGSEHEDNARFLADCEQWFGLEVTRLRSDEYVDTWDVWERTRWLAGPQGARCTGELKVRPRITFQRDDDVHVFGYTADSNDVARAQRLRDNFFELTVETPLIERGITKAGCFELVQRAGIDLPVTYSLGFPNANCLPCVKATSPAYWALVRKRFPEKFQRMARLARELDVRLARLNGERVFIDDIPNDMPVLDAVAPSCDFLCEIAAEGLE